MKALNIMRHENYIKIMKVGTIVTALILFLGISESSYAEEPVIEGSGENRKLVLPQKFENFISAKYPSYRVPVLSDMDSVWALLKNKMDGLPYVTWGDYNADGLTDIAIFLISNSKEWQFIIFLKTVDSYKVSLVNGTPEVGYQPQVAYVSTIKKGNTLEYVATNENTGKEEMYSFGFPHDAVRYQVGLELPIDVYYWVGGKLKEDIFGLH